MKMKLTRIYLVALTKQPPHLELSLRIGRAMPPLPLHSVPSWHVIGRALNCTCTNKTSIMDVVRRLGKLNIRGKCVNNTSTRVNNFKMDRGYLS